MLQALVSTASRRLNHWARSLLRERVPATETTELTPTSAQRYQRLQRVVLTDEVSRTLFEEYAAHRNGVRSEEETGWVLLGLRAATEAVVLATLPAGANRDAGVAHVLFNSTAQALACRFARQRDRRLQMLGVVHTHPGSLRHPSTGDYRGDCLWVGQLRGKEGIFGIGTADGVAIAGLPVAYQPRPHVQCLGELCLSWYSLGEGDGNYHPLKVDLTLGPDLALPLHSVWDLLETYAEPLDCLYRQLSGVTFQAVNGGVKPALQVEIKLAKGGRSLQLLLQEDGPQCYLVREEEMLAAQLDEEPLDRGVFLLLARLAGQE